MNDDSKIVLDASLEERKELVACIRYFYLTLGFYRTPFNYDPKNDVRHPITGEVCSGILHDGGREAAEASDRFRGLVFKVCPELFPRGLEEPGVGGTNEK